MTLIQNYAKQSDCQTMSGTVAEHLQMVGISVNWGEGCLITRACLELLMFAILLFLLFDYKLLSFISNNIVYCGLCG